MAVALHPLGRDTHVPGVVTAIDKLSGQNDDAFGQGAKENSAVPSVVTGSIPNNKSDLTRFHVAHETIGDNVFLYLGWERANTLGTANIDFEFNQSETLSANGVTPVRTTGDLLFGFDFSSGGNTIVLTMRKWQASGQWGAPVNLSALG